MDEKTKERLKNIPKSKCSKCGTSRSYGNPLAKCFECGKKFCFDHILGAQYKKGMKDNDELRDVCESCKERLGY